MELIFFTGARFLQAPDGQIFSFESSFAYPLFKRYLKYFNKIYISARVTNENHLVVSKENIVSGESIEVIHLPYYVGFNEFIKKRAELRKAIRLTLKNYVNAETVIICRLPGRIGAIAIQFLKKANHPYGIEIVGDPLTALTSKGAKHPLLPILRILSYFSLKNLVFDAPAAIYVTKYQLQTRYPCRNFNIGVSDVLLKQDAYLIKPKLLFRGSVIYLICIGSLEQLYKGPDIALLSVKQLIKSGINCHLTWVGDGFYRKEMEKLAKKLKISASVTFIGKLEQGEAVQKELDKADIFIMPSRTEGLPRAMVEAMARAIPCIGTKVGGIPELLEENMLIPVNNAKALTEKIKFLIRNPHYAEEQGLSNKEKSRAYSEETLNQEREQFYNYLKNLYQKTN
jgi:glycosyltransferase involved in cell wall biosynthesis